MFLILIYFVILIFIAFALFGAWYRYNSGVCTCQNKLYGKTVIITGATAGIGRETAKDLASRGARVILACRNMEKALETKEWIVSTTGNKDIVCRYLDLSDLSTVRKFAEEILEEEAKIDILINNAGGGFMSRQESKQGYELTIATNHYGPFLLTNLLLERIVKSSPSRIINVSSVAHKTYTLDVDDIHYKKRPYGFFRAYAQSKLCNILFTKELSHRLTGKEVTVNVLHPGGVATDFMKIKNPILSYLAKLLGSIGAKSSELGAQTTIHLAVSDEGGHITGEYFVDCKIAETSKKAHDPKLAKEIWEFTADEVELKENEKYI